MAKSGRYMYVPRIMIDEVQNLKIEEELDSRAEAFKKMARYGRMGRQYASKGNIEIPIGKRSRRWL